MSTQLVAWGCTPGLLPPGAGQQPVQLMVRNQHRGQGLTL